METMEKEHKASLSLTCSDLCSWCWSHLPPELLDQIYALLSPSDRHRFRLICSTWRGVARQSIPPFPLVFSPPRVLLTGPDNNLSFFDIFNCKSLSCSIPPPHNRARCFGYLAGWFFLVSDQNPSLQNPSRSRACLFNPVLLAEIPLPDLDSPIEKAILSAAPGFPNCVVAVMGWSGFIALCEPAGKRWQVLHLGESILLLDIIFWRNQLWIVNRREVLICNFDMESCKTSILPVPLPQHYRRVVDAFLLESTDGNLLTVTVHHRKFWVFKLVQQCTWEQMERIGNQALFLGRIRSESVPVNQFLDSGLRENSIYCTSGRCMVKFMGRYGVPIVYSMEDGAVRAVLVSGRYWTQAEPVLVSPVIWP